MGIDRIKGEGDDLVDVEEIVTATNLNAKKGLVTAAVQFARVAATTFWPILHSKTNTDAVPSNAYIAPVAGHNHAYNETADKWQRWRNNTEGTILASAARTVTLYSAEQTNFNHKGIYIFINVSAISATPSLTIRLLIKDSISGLFSAFTAYTPAITAVGTYVIALYPGLVDTAGTFCLACDAMLPRTWKLHVVHANTDSITYSISHQSIV